MADTTKKEILSLRGIYRFLVINDYPCYSEGIITKKNHKGLTLTKFWKDHLLYDFCSGKYGRQIWRAQGGRNRYISDICNRSERICFYREYAEELSLAASPEAVLRQIRQFASFLIERQFHYPSFMQKLPVYIRMLAENDECFTQGAQTFFEEALARKASYDGTGDRGRAFYCGYFLTFLTFHALAGNGGGEESICRIRENQALTLSELENRYKDENRTQGGPVVFITNKNTELCSEPLRAGHFFGREKELFELRERLARGGRYLISGIGGIGKTELMRQLIRYCQEERLADCICVVQYEKSLTDSMIKAFSEVYGTDREQNFKEALSRIRIHEGKRILIVIDNMTEEPDPSEAKELCGLPATVFVTSRCHKMDGFETYQVGACGQQACELIFRDHYGRPLTAEDEDALYDLTGSDIWRHTLTLRLLGCVAATRNWSVKELLERLRKGEMSAPLLGRERYERLGEMYRRTYMEFGLGRHANLLLKGFAFLPYGSYSPAFAEIYLSGYAEPGMDMQRSLEELWACGWLEKDAAGYSMHPFISECILAKDPKEKDLAPFLERVIAAWERTQGKFEMTAVRSLLGTWFDHWEESEQELMHVTLLALSAAQRLKGNLEDRFLKLLLMAAEIEYYYLGFDRKRLAFLMQMRTRLKKASSLTKGYLYMLLCMHNHTDIDELRQEYERLLANPDAPEKMKYEFANLLVEKYLYLDSREEAESLNQYVMENSTDPDILAAAYFYKAEFLIQSGEAAEQERLIKRAKGYLIEAGREKSKLMEEIHCLLCTIYLGIHDFANAEKTLAEAEHLLDQSKSYTLRMRLRFFRGELALYREDPGFGISDMREALKLAEAMSADEDYIDIISELAMGYNKAGERTEADRYYKKAVALYGKMPGHAFSKCRVVNNMCVMYLDWNRPEEALRYLTEVYPEAREIGGILEAEINYNLARTWRMLGEEEKSLAFLREAAPVLEQYYGSQHKKVIEAKNRLAAL